MSGSLASAKAKRAGINPPPPAPVPVQTPQQQQQQIPPGSRMTIPQVIALLDSRLAKLEIGARSPISTSPTTAALEDMEAKFMMLAEEITMMKDVIMKLQAFTMDVNKTLFEERIQIMSEMDGGIKSQVVDEAITFEKVSEVSEVSEVTVDSTAM
jgi:hypothetical protein